MHACGHDTHIAMLLTAAQILSEHQNELCGNVKLLFQGGEETAIGAKYYVDQGIMDGVDAVYGCHIATWLDAPYISVNEGPHFAGTDEFYIYVKGKCTWRNPTAWTRRCRCRISDCYELAVCRVKAN